MGIETYIDGDGANMGGEVLLDRPAGPELVAGRDHPEADDRVFAYPPMHPEVLALGRVLVFVVHLHDRVNNELLRELYWREYNMTYISVLFLEYLQYFTSPLRSGLDGLVSTTASGYARGLLLSLDRSDAVGMTLCLWSDMAMK